MACKGRKSGLECGSESRMNYWKNRHSLLLTQLMMISTIFRANILFRNFHVNDHGINVMMMRISNKIQVYFSQGISADSIWQL